MSTRKFLGACYVTPRRAFRRLHSLRDGFRLIRNTREATTMLLAVTVLIVVSTPTLTAFGDVGPLSSPLRPNILVIMTDDQRHDPDYSFADTIDLPDVNAPGQPWMPSIRKWFKDGSVSEGITGGVEFTRALATTPSCCPSRASIFTGQYAHNTTVRQRNPENHLPLCSSPKGGSALDPCRTDRTLQHYVKSIPSELDPYRTAIFGKYLNNWDVQPLPTDLDGDGTAPRAPADFDEWGIFNNGYYNYPAYEKIGGGSATPVPNVSQYSTTYVREHAKNFIARDRSRPGPWLMYVHPYAPHLIGGYEGCADMACMVDTPYRPSGSLQVQSLAELGIDPADSQYPSYLEQDINDKPASLYPDCCDDPGGPTTTSVARVREIQLRALKSVDDMVEQIFDSMTDDERLNTIVFYFSDNGYCWGDHFLDGKLLPYTCSVRVPMYMRWPAHLNRGYINGASRTEDAYLRANLDIAPTVMHALGITGMIPTGQPMDGRSMLAPPTGDDFSLDRTARDRWLVEFWGDASIAAASGLNSYASNRWGQSAEYTEYFPGTSSTSPPPCDATSCPSSSVREYYDIVSDPFELFNTHSDGNTLNDEPGFMPARLAKDRRCKGQDRLTVEPPPCP